jgi:RimJ/RimL family protein N-acetyltransferase
VEKIETPRLLLRRPVPADVPALARINADPEVMKYIGAGRVRTFDETAEGVARAIREWDERGHGMFSVDRRDTGEYVGWVALTEPAFLPEVLPAIEIGWRLDRAHWGHGFATEAARAALRFGFETCGFDAVLSIRHVANDASRRVMEKLGLHFDFTTRVPAHGQAVAVHSISRAEFEELRPVAPDAAGPPTAAPAP